MNGIAETVLIVYKTGKLDRANRVWPRSETCAFGALAVVLGAASGSPHGTNGIKGWPLCPSSAGWDGSCAGDSPCETFLVKLLDGNISH